MIPMLALAMTLAIRPAVSVHCAADARTQALKLLRFHSDDDDRAAIEAASIRKIGTVASLAGKRRFDVLELYGDVYKARYRLRLTYADVSGECVLMGQEIFEVGNL